MLKKTDGKWYEVTVTVENIVQNGPRETIFRTRIKDVAWKEVKDPGKLEEALRIIQEQLEIAFNEGQDSVPYKVFIFRMGHELRLTEETVEDLVKALIERTGSYQIRDRFIFKITKQEAGN